MSVIEVLPKWIRNFLKRSELAVVLLNKMNWKLYLFKDWWGTRVWTRTSEVTTPLGFKLVSGFHPAYKLMREGRFELDETVIIRRLLGDIDVFVDVGANLGYYTCLAAMHGKHVIAIEPQQQNVRCLTRNLMVNGYQDHVEIFPVALSSKPGLLTLFGASGPSASLIKGWAGYSPRHNQLVPVSTLDNILGTRFSDKQIFVKVDVEGAEFQVLEGARVVLSRGKKPFWLVEICLHEFHPAGTNPAYLRIFELFWDQGYEAYTATDPLRLVRRKDITTWIESNSSNRATHNYLFADKELGLGEITTC